MQTEETSRLRYVASGLKEHRLDVVPLDASERARISARIVRRPKALRKAPTEGIRQAATIQGLGAIVPKPRPDGPHGIGYRRLTRHHDSRELRIQRAQTIEQAKTRPVAQILVDDETVRDLYQRRPQGLAPPIGGGDGPSAVDKFPRERLSSAARTVDQEN